MTRNIFEHQTCTDIHIHLCISHVTHGLTRVEKGNNTRLSAYDSQSVCNISSSDKLPVPAIHALHCPLTSRGMIGGEKASPRNRTCQFVHTPALRCPLRPRQPVSTRTRRTAQAHHLPPRHRHPAPATQPSPTSLPTPRRRQRLPCRKNLGGLACGQLLECCLLQQGAGAVLVPVVQRRLQAKTCVMGT